MIINYKKCFLIGLLFEIIALLILVGGASLNQGFFAGPALLFQTMVFIPYLILQGFLVVVLTVLLRDKLSTSKLKSGVIVGLLMWFFNQKLLIVTTSIANIITFIPLGTTPPDPTLILSIVGSVIISLVIYLVLGLILVYLVDKFYFKKQKLEELKNK